MLNKEMDQLKMVDARMHSLTCTPAKEVEEWDLTAAFLRYLNCPCRCFAPVADDDIMMAAYLEAHARGETEGFVPMFITVDETLWDCLIMNSSEDTEHNADYAFDAVAVAKYRQAILQAPLTEGAEETAKLLKIRQEEAAEDELDWQNEVLGSIAGGEVCDRFAGYWDFGTGNTLPLILAEIPVKHPWEIFAWLPFGGWNECPDTLELMAVTKYWHEQHGAIPAVMTHDVLEFILPHPVPEEHAMQLALEQYAWCPDVVEQGIEDCTVGLLADTLRQSVVWYFWWD